MDNMRLMERDYIVLNLIYRFRFCLGRHVHVLANFSSSRTCDRRLKILFEHGFVMRKKYIYGVPYLYTLTARGKTLIGVNKRLDKIRIDQITHDVRVLDTVIYFKDKYDLELNKFVSEKELHSIDGFGTRKHYPDVLITVDDETYAIEVELSLKSKERLNNNVKNNFLAYDNQIWIVPRNSKIHELIKYFQGEYSNMDIIYLEDI